MNFKKILAVTAGAFSLIATANATDCLKSHSFPDAMCVAELKSEFDETRSDRLLVSDLSRFEGLYKAACFFDKRGYWTMQEEPAFNYIAVITPETITSIAQRRNNTFKGHGTSIISLTDQVDFDSQIRQGYLLSLPVERQDRLYTRYVLSLPLSRLIDGAFYSGERSSGERIQLNEITYKVSGTQILAKHTAKDENGSSVMYCKGKLAL